MEDFLKDIKTAFDLPDIDPHNASPIILAYIGDAVYDVITRTILISFGNRQINAINKDNKRLVNAETQARLSEVLKEVFDEEEAVQFKRGRNAKSQSSAKNASIKDYRKATGLEAVIGYLYLIGKKDRITDLLKTGFEKLDFSFAPGKEVIKRK